MLLPQNNDETQTAPTVPAETNSGSGLISALRPKTKIPGGTAISGIPVGGMTAEQATSTVQNSVSDVYEKQNMVIIAGEKELRLSPQMTNIHWAIEDAVSSALNGDEQNVPLELA